VVVEKKTLEEQFNDIDLSELEKDRLKRAFLILCAYDENSMSDKIAKLSAKK
jgi:hypothetical protein